jgi:hypothetical protein
MRKFLFSLFFIACPLVLFAQNWPSAVYEHLSENMNDELYRYFGLPEQSALAIAVVHPLSWIGNMAVNNELEDNPWHFYAGASASAATVTSRLSDFLGDGPYTEFGAYVAPVVRIGGFVMPFDIGLSGISMSFLDGDDLTTVTNVAVDFRYQIIREGYGFDWFDSTDNLLHVIAGSPFIPAFSMGLGFGLFMLEKDSFFEQQLFDTLAADADIKIKLESYVIYFSFQLSKHIWLGDFHSEHDMPVLFLNEPPIYLIPYLGLKLLLGTSRIRGIEHLTNMGSCELIVPAEYYAAQKHEDKLALRPIFYGGTGIKFFGAGLLNIGLSYDPRGDILGVVLSFGLQL